MIRILLVDGHDGVRLGLSTALATVEDMAVVGQATSGTEAVRLCGLLLPDVVLMEIQLPNGDGIGTLQRIRHYFPSIQVVVLTSATTTDLKRRAEADGAWAYLPKYVAVDELIQAIRAAHCERGRKMAADSEPPAGD